MNFDSTWAYRDCPYCNTRRVHMAVLQKDYKPQDTGESLEQASIKLYSILSCRACGGVVTIMHNPGFYGELTVYPEDINSVNKVKHLPEDVSGYFAEALVVLNAGAPNSAAVSIRKTIEAAAAHFDIKEHNLVKSIQKLVAEGHVTKNFGEAVDQVRLMGNVGAHASDKTVDENGVRRVLGFTTQLLRNLFEVPGELAALNSGEVESADEPAPPAAASTVDGPTGSLMP